MIDFDRLILGPAMAAFARPLQFLPLVSQMNAPTPYLARGDFREPHSAVDLETGELSTSYPTIGIRLAEFAVPPARGDKVVVLPKLLEAARTFLIVDVQPDGEGDCKLILAEVTG